MGDFNYHCRFFSTGLNYIQMIIGITGTIGAGKGTVVEYLVQYHGFQHYSVRALLTEEVIRRGLLVNRDNMLLVADEWRATYGPDYAVRTLFARAAKLGGHVVIESVRALGEADFLRSQSGFSLWSVDAPPKTRYERVLARGSATDQINWEKFLIDDEREMRNSDPTRGNIAACMALADVALDNSGSREALYRQIDAALK